MVANALRGLAEVLDFVLLAYQWVLIARAVISWVNADPRNPIVAFLHAITEPAVRAIRRRLPANLRYFPIDIAFLVLFGLVIFARYFVVASLADYGELLRMRARQPALLG